MRSTTFSHVVGVKRDRQQNYATASAAPPASAREFAASASKLAVFLATVPKASKVFRFGSLCMLLHAAASDLRPSNVTAAFLISNLDRLGIETAGYRESLQSFVRDRTNRKPHRGALAPKAQCGAQRSITPETRAIETSDALTTEVVPQNTVAMVKPGDRSVRKLVTLQVLDCVELTQWDPITKTGGMAHIPSGSSADLGPLREELKKQALSTNRLQFTVLGGADYALTLPRGSDDFIPLAIQNFYSIERQLFAVGVADGAVKLPTIQSVAEKNAGMSNIGIDLATGRPFLFIDSQKKLANAANRGHLELQDSTTDLYIVGS